MLLLLLHPPTPVAPPAAHADARAAVTPAATPCCTSCRFFCPPLVPTAARAAAGRAGAFDDDDIVHVEGSVDPVRDIEIIHDELRLKDEELIAPILDKLEKMAVRGNDKKLKPEYDIMCKIKSWVVDEKKHIRFHPDWNDKEIEVLNKHLLLTSKPMVYLVNLSEKDYIRKKNKW
ncbi:obg-like ATPase 1 [Callorhinchus milii]|uniref:obg-like ATPase 1 n=1 Tax=Callorhinchus milii TaxID=7868 RepID=UPI001C3FAE49|nr:obg-like ATPase 1 [Callorhinchus milii]